MHPWNEFLTTGRLGRAGFWLRHAVVLPVALFLCICADQVVGRTAGFVAALLTTWFLVSVWGRRLHDRGRSAWWLLAVCVPLLGALALFVDCALLGSRGAAPGRAAGARPDYRIV